MGNRATDLAARTILRIALGLACALVFVLWRDSGVVFAETVPVVKAYVCPPGSAPATADQLRTEFGVIPDVRIAADERTSQIIVVATPEIQACVGQRLAGLASAATSPPEAAVAATSPSAPPADSVSVPLRTCTPEQLEASLQAILGNRLFAIPAPGPQTRCYRLAMGGGGNVRLTIDGPTRQATVEGSATAVHACARLLQALDSSSDGGDSSTRLFPLRTTKPASIQRAIATIHQTTGAAEPSVAMASTQTEQPAGAGGPRVGLAHPVEIESLEGLEVVVLRGRAQDVEQVMEIIKQLERVSAETEPAIEVLPLRYVDCVALEPMLQTLYEQIYVPRQGIVSITAVVKPNALLVVGRRENVATVLDLARKLDQPVAPDTQFQVFRLRHASAVAAQATIAEFYDKRGGLGPQLRVTPDGRSNSLLVQAGPRDMQELAALIDRIDTSQSAAVNELRIVQLEYSLAADLVAVLRTAMGVTASEARSAGPRGEGAEGGGQKPSPAQGPRPQGEQRSAMLRFLTVDAKGRRLVESGILTDVRITADTQANAVIVSAPAECVELIETLVRQLDTLPAAEAHIKVFTIVNGDAPNLEKMLETLFAARAAAGGNQAEGPAATPSGAARSLVPLRFAVDTRTNSIIASGSLAELTVVEAILLRLDDSEVSHRKTEVFRLKNSPADTVAQAINEFLRTQRQMEQQQAPGMTSAFEQIEREVVVVPEMVSNSLILSATPRFFGEIRGLIDQLDARPPMVMIQVLIAQVDLENTDEFGIELGLQDGLLFDRSILDNIQKTTTTITNPNQTTQTTESIVSATNTPGVNFNNIGPLGNSGAESALRNSSLVGGQGISSFGLQRAGSLGFGGLVLSASSESVSFLLRALSECRRVEVLERPQVMTLDNQPAYIQVGQKVPIIKSASINSFGQINVTDFVDVGLILSVIPRISPDGLVVMQIDAEKSEMGPDAEGTPVTVADNQVIRSPRINRIYAGTVVSATSGQTVVLGGLISKSTQQFHRKVPCLGDIPILGHLFRFDSETTLRRELLIIMTPHIVRNEADADAIKLAEAARMNWCLCDVVQIYGDAGLRGRTDDWSDAETQVIYPDMKLTPGSDSPGTGPEIVPTPAVLPTEQRPSTP